MQLGNREIVFNDSFILPENEPLKISVPLAKLGGPLPVEVSCVRGTPEGQPVTWKFNGGKLVMEFSGFKPSLPQVLNSREPHEIGMIEGERFGFFFAIQNIDNVAYLLHLTFFRGGTYVK